MTGVDLLGGIPNWLADQLSGFTVRGNYNDPNSIMVLPKSLDDIHKAAPNLIKTTSRLGRASGRAGRT